jgi:hypothetical protein
MTPLEDRLAALAAAGQTIPYGVLARDLGLRMADLTAALEALMEADTAAGQPLRAALCEARLTPGLPARGFFDKAAALGHDISDPAAFVATQLRRLSAP